MYETSAPIGAWKCNFPTYNAIMKDQPTNQQRTKWQTNQPANGRTRGRSEGEVTRQITEHLLSTKKSFSHSCACTTGSVMEPRVKASSRGRRIKAFML